MFLFYISFGGGCEGLGVSKKSLFIIVDIPDIFLLIICSFYVFFTFMLVCVSVFVHLCVHKCVVVQLSMSYGNLNVCLGGLQIMRAHSFLNFIFLVIREKNSFFRECNLYSKTYKPSKESLSSSHLSLHQYPWNTDCRFTGRGGRFVTIYIDRCVAI